MEYVTLVNRTSKKLQGTWDGRQFVVLPGESMLPKAVAYAVKRQNPLMGSGSYELHDTIYLVGVKEDGDDISPIEQSNSLELIDPKILHAATVAQGRRVETVPGVAGMFKSRNTVASELPPASGNEMVTSGFDRD